MKNNYHYNDEKQSIGKDIMDKHWLKDRHGKFICVRDKGIVRHLEYDMQQAMFKCSLELLTYYWHSMTYEAKMRAKWSRKKIQCQIK